MTKPKLHLADYTGKAVCGFARNNLTYDHEEVTCELCLKPKIPHEKTKGNIKELTDAKFLLWIHARLKDWHGDDRALYHMRRLEKLARKLEKEGR